ncbi:MAG: diphosphomevalonate decarboxylase [Chloroflexota bacterium]
MSKTTIRAGSNIAFVKYWGVADAQLHLPLSNSISMTLANAYTTTTVEWDSTGQMDEDQIEIDGVSFSGGANQRTVAHLDRIRQVGRTTQRAKVVSQNNFPMASGIASSASGFAALTQAGCMALGLDLSAADLSRLARLGSGSASRSLFGGFVEWEKGHDDESSVAHQIHPSSHWNLCDVVVIVNREEKKISSASGHQLAHTSPLLQGRLDSLPQALTEVRQAINDKDLTRLGPFLEQDALAMHAVMMTSTPNLFYWRSGTVEIIHLVQEWRANGTEVYYTIDAGPNMHLICEADTAQVITPQLEALPYVQQVIVSGPGEEPAVVEDALF